MKKNLRKTLVLGVCAVLLVAVTVVATLAYFTDKDDVTNTFTVGKVQISIDEVKIGADGVTPATPAARVTSNKYKLVPSHTYTKNTQVHVTADSENAYVFVKIANDITAIESKTTSKQVASQVVANGWTLVQGETNVYYKEYTSQSTVKDLAVYESFTVDPSATATDIAPYDADQGSQKNITVTAYAIQKEGTTDYKDAWTKVKNA